MKKAAFLIALIGTIFSGFAQSEYIAMNNEANISQEKIVHLTAETFKKKVFDYENNKEWKYEGDLPAIVDFYADWCRPCKMIAPILVELQAEYDGKLVIYKVDVDDEKELASVFQATSIPALLFIPTTGQPQMAKGALPKETFEKVIKDVLKVN